MKPIEMLTEVLRRAQLSHRERESFEDMLDRITRFQRCSDRQKAWIEKVYFGQQLDRTAPVQKRRVVTPTWQKKREEENKRTQGIPAPLPKRGETLIKAVSAPAAPTPTSRQVLVKNRPQTGTFMATPAVTQRAPQVGYINYAGVQRETPVTSVPHFEAICPRIEPGSRQHRRVADFFARGGIVLKVKPLNTAQVA